MASSLFSPSWYRVQELKPRLRRHVEVRRHSYRDRVWFILEDLASGRAHRLTPEAYRLVGLMDGRRTLNDLWALVTEQLGPKAPTQDEAIRLMGQLHAADALICDTTPDSRELFRRHQKQERTKLRQKIWSPLAVRIPLWDPDIFLTRTMPVARIFFTRTFAVLWLIVVTLGALYAVMNFGAITESVLERVLTPANLAVLWLVYPVVKAFHELAHGYAVKKEGGEVHEMGIMFLVLIPVPYVDASAASGFRDKYHRILVGGVGIMVEMLFASVALFVWLNAEPGAVTVVAYNVMLIGGVSTLLFNGNPLLRFDGYYVLSDWLEIPNLGTRSNKHLGYVVQKYLFGNMEAEPVATLPSERKWLVGYGIAAFIYRMFIMFAIIAYIAGRFFVIGVILAIWAVAVQLIVPLSKGIGFLISSPRLQTNRHRAVMVTLALVGMVAGLLFVLPAPYRTLANGVTWPSEQAQIRAGTNGIVTRLFLSGQPTVLDGQTLIEVDEPFLKARLDLMRTELRSLGIQRDAVFRRDRVEADLISAEIEALTSDIARLEEQVADLEIASPRQGVAIIPRIADLEGRFVRQGDALGYVVTPKDALTVRVAIDQDDVDLVRQQTRAVHVMPVDWHADRYEARILREVPGGTTRLPSPALGVGGGGDIPIDPAEGTGTATLERVFDFELQIDDTDPLLIVGRRVMVRFDHGYKPMGIQFYHKMRKLFLRLYDV